MIRCRGDTARVDMPSGKRGNSGLSLVRQGAG